MHPAPPLVAARTPVGVGGNCHIGAVAADERQAMPGDPFRRTGGVVADERAAETNLAGPPALARTVGLSPSRLAHLFTAALGRPPARCLEKQRPRRAALLLANTARTVTEIAADVGFENAFYFSARFKHRAGCSPRAFRQLSHRQPSRTEGR